jgi:uncharacterized protein YbjT (DUF2867 family)
MSNKILVTGATGTIGKALVKALTTEQASFVAGVRDKEKAAGLLGADVSLAAFDFADASTFEGATEGVDKVFLLGPPMVMQLDSLLKPFIDFLKGKDITRVVYVSALGMETLTELPFHNNVVEKLKADGFDYTILKPTFFAQNFKNYEWENITERGITFAPAGSGKVAFVDVEDIAAVAAKVLTSDGHSGKAYEITGPQSYSYAEAADLLSEVTGKKIVYPNPSPEEYAGALKAGGAPDFIAPYMISVYSMIANNKVDRVTSVTQTLTGKAPATFKEVLERDFSRN